jgi:hypothetical protein
MFVNKDLAATVNDSLRITQDVEVISVSSVAGLASLSTSGESQDSPELQNSLKEITREEIAFDPPEPPLYSSLEECLDRFDSKVRILRAIEDAGHDDKLKLKQLETLVKNFLEAQYNRIRSGDWKWQPKS